MHSDGLPVLFPVRNINSRTESNMFLGTTIPQGFSEHMEKKKTFNFGYENTHWETDLLNKGYGGSISVTIVELLRRFKAGTLF